MRDSGCGGCGDVGRCRVAAALAGALLCAAALLGAPGLPESLRVVLEGTRPLEYPRGGDLPLYVLPITSTLRGIGDAETERVLRELDARGIGYTADWDPSPEKRDRSLAEGLRIGRLQERLGLRVAVNATACLHAFFDGSPGTLHVDDAGRPFADMSFPGGRIGCPFALSHRVAPVKEQVDFFLRGYRRAGVAVGFAFADWEIDGPLEWNGAWDAARRCRRCRERLGGASGFRAFQRRVRLVRSELQRAVFGDNVTASFPRALVGNYAVYPHGGERYWYDYFERPLEAGTAIPHRSDGRARYREWFHEFGLTGYTFAMPVVYTWYPIHGWYDFPNSDYRWFYNMLLVGSNAGKHTSAATPIITFVHWTTTAPPADPDPAVKQMSRSSYRELLWHLLLRGHDAFFLWCTRSELRNEIPLVHETWADALKYRDFLRQGTPISFSVPRRPGPVISGLRLGRRVLVRRTDFDDTAGPVLVPASPWELRVPRAEGRCQILTVAAPATSR